MLHDNKDEIEKLSQRISSLLKSEEKANDDVTQRLRDYVRKVLSQSFEKDQAMDVNGYDVFR